MLIVRLLMRIDCDETRRSVTFGMIFISICSIFVIAFIDGMKLGLASVVWEIAIITIVMTLTTICLFVLCSWRHYEISESMVRLIWMGKVQIVYKKEDGFFVNSKGLLYWTTGQNRRHEIYWLKPGGKSISTMVHALKQYGFEVSDRDIAT